MGKYSKEKKEHELKELKKILIFGVSREYDLCCIRKWLSELTFQVVCYLLFVVFVCCLLFAVCCLQMLPARWKFEANYCGLK